MRKLNQFTLVRSNIIATLCSLICVLSGKPVRAQISATFNYESPTVQELNRDKEVYLDFKSFEKPAIVFYWASWCGFCKEFSTAIQNSTAGRERSIKVVGISVDTELSEARKASLGFYSFISKNFWIGPTSGSTALADRPKGLPLVLLVGANGEVDTVYEGSNGDKLEYFKKRVALLITK